MMATYAKDVLTGAADGLGVLVAATASPGTTVHTGPTATSTMHEVWLFASNPDSADHTLTLQWGDTSDSVKVTVKAYDGLRPVVPGLIIKGNATPLVVKAYADTTNKVRIFGFVNVIT